MGNTLVGVREKSGYIFASQPVVVAKLLMTQEVMLVKILVYAGHWSAGLSNAQGIPASVLKRRLTISRWLMVLHACHTGGFSYAYQMLECWLTWQPANCIDSTGSAASENFLLKVFIAFCFLHFSVTEYYKKSFNTDQYSIQQQPCQRRSAISSHF